MLGARPHLHCKIEDLIFELKENYTVIIVTHNMQQAARVAEFTAFFLMGSLIEYDQTSSIFTTPTRQEDGRLHHRKVRMTRTRFHQGLEELKHKLLAMGGMAEQAVDTAVEAYRRRDLKLCHAVFEGEKAINAIEREIDELALDLLAMQQPMAVDLRFITAVMKINADLERVGDQAVNIAERVMNTVKLPKAELPVDVPRMAATVAGMVRRALESFWKKKPSSLKRY